VDGGSIPPISTITRVTVALQEEDPRMTALVVLSGPPGIGKSTVANAVAALHPVVRLSIDDVEEAMLACGIPPEQTVPTRTAATALRAASEPAAGGPVAAYEVVRAAAEQNLALGADVVVDAVNDSEPARETWRRAVEATASRLLQVVLAMDDAPAHRARLEGRTWPFVRLAEPTWARVTALRATTVPWSGDVLRLDAAWPPDELARRVLAELSPSGSPGAAA
jgi:predicted kinase